MGRTSSPPSYTAARPSHTIFLRTGIGPKMLEPGGGVSSPVPTGPPDPGRPRRELAAGSDARARPAAADVLSASAMTAPPVMAVPAPRKLRRMLGWSMDENVSRASAGQRERFMHGSQRVGEGPVRRPTGLEGSLWGAAEETHPEPKVLTRRGLSTFRRETEALRRCRRCACHDGGHLRHLRRGAGHLTGAAGPPIPRGTGPVRRRSSHHEPL